MYIMSLSSVSLEYEFSPTDINDSKFDSGNESSFNPVLISSPNNIIEITGITLTKDTINNKISVKVDIDYDEVNRTLDDGFKFDVNFKNNANFDDQEWSSLIITNYDNVPLYGNGRQFEEFQGVINDNIAPPNLNLSNFSLEFCFVNATNFNSNINNWNVSNVTKMLILFAGCEIFNQPLNDWNVSNVTNMLLMFSGCKKFNQPLSNWNVSNVISMAGLFQFCSSFNQDISMWKTDNLTDIGSIFFGNKSLNQKYTINFWNLSKIQSVSGSYFGTSISIENHSQLLNDITSDNFHPEYLGIGGPNSNILNNQNFINGGLDFSFFTQFRLETSDNAFNLLNSNGNILIDGGSISINEFEKIKELKENNKLLLNDNTNNKTTFINNSFLMFDDGGIERSYNDYFSELEDEIGLENINPTNDTKVLTHTFKNLKDGDRITGILSFNDKDNQGNNYNNSLRFSYIDNNNNEVEVKNFKFDENNIDETINGIDNLKIEFTNGPSYRTDIFDNIIFSKKSDLTRIQKVPLRSYTFNPPLNPNNLNQFFSLSYLRDYNENIIFEDSNGVLDIDNEGLSNNPSADVNNPPQGLQPSLEKDINGDIVYTLFNTKTAREVLESTLRVQPDLNNLPPNLTPSYLLDFNGEFIFENSNGEQQVDSFGLSNFANFTPENPPTNPNLTASIEKDINGNNIFIDNNTSNKLARSISISNLLVDNIDPTINYNNIVPSYRTFSDLGQGFILRYDTSARNIDNTSNADITINTKENNINVLSIDKDALLLNENIYTGIMTSDNNGSSIEIKSLNNDDENSNIKINTNYIPSENENTFYIKTYRNSPDRLLVIYPINNKPNIELVVEVYDLADNSKIGSITYTSNIQGTFDSNFNLVLDTNGIYNIVFNNDNGDNLIITGDINNITSDTIQNYVIENTNIPIGSNILKTENKIFISNENQINTFEEFDLNTKQVISIQNNDNLFINTMKNMKDVNNQYGNYYLALFNNSSVGIIEVVNNELNVLQNSIRNVIGGDTTNIDFTNLLDTTNSAFTGIEPVKGIALVPTSNDGDNTITNISIYEIVYDSNGNPSNLLLGRSDLFNNDVEGINNIQLEGTLQNNNVYDLSVVYLDNGTFVSTTFEIDGDLTCFTGDMNVKTIDGYKEIRNITLDDKLITGDNRVIDIKSISHIKTEKDILYRLPTNSFRNNANVVLTKYHAFFDKDSKKFVRPMDLKNSKNYKYNIEGKVDLYNIELFDKDNDTFIVNGLVVEGDKQKHGTRGYFKHRNRNRDLIRRLSKN